MAGETFFELPNVPEEFGVILPPPNLRRINFSGLDYVTCQRAIVEYIQTYYPGIFNDFIASNGVMMFTDIVASVAAKLSLRQDLLANESNLPSAQTEPAVVNQLALIGQRLLRQTPAITDIEISVDRPAFTDIEIDAGTSFSVRGPDGANVTYEIYRAPGDWTSKIVIPAGKRSVIAYGLEGEFASPLVTVSPGGANQQFTATGSNILESPLIVNVTFGNVTEEWDVIREPIERFGPNDKVVEVRFEGDRTIFTFGDDVHGQAPASGSSISFSYRVGGGIRGRIGVGQIDTSRQLFPLPPANAVVSVHFRNVTASLGGTDKESLAQAKRRAPRDFAMPGSPDRPRSIVTGEDYAQAASFYSHPVYGSVSKAVATIRTDKNANLTEIYVLAQSADDLPALPNLGLKQGLKTFFNELNVLTDHVSILDGAIKPVDLEMTIVVNRSADASVVKAQVEATITSYFNISNWEMGKPLYISNLIEVIEAVDGVAYVDIYTPSNNILPTGKIGEAGSSGVGFNEVITEGTRKTSYYYERTPPPNGIRSGI